MNFPRLCFVSILFITGFVSHAADDKGTQVAATVVNVGALPGLLLAGPIRVTFLVNSPASMRGTEFMLQTPSRNRAEVRAQYPKGSIHAMTLPASVVSNLIEQAKMWESGDESIDHGVPPQMISNGALLPDIPIAELPKAPSPVSMKP